MSYVIAHGCCRDGSCIDVCPVDCIRPRPGEDRFATAEQLYIDPGTCIECGACAEACPVDAIHLDLDLADDLKVYADLARAFFDDNPIRDWTRPLFPEPVRLEPETLRVAIVGSGPAASYAADGLSSIRGTTVSLFEKLPTPHGLLRSGVAPDHLPTKRIAEQFDEVMARPGVHCYFNVEVGRDVNVGELLDSHHAVIVAAGAGFDNQLRIPGEGVAGTIAARSFVGWYNGHPDNRHLDIDLSAERAVIVGNGNVALDIARILTAPPQALRLSDIADHALERLERSAVREVVVVGRGAPASAAFSTSEFLALARSPGVDILVDRKGVPAHAPDHPAFAYTERSGRATQASGSSRKTVRFRFMLEPVRIIARDGALASVEFRRRGVGSSATELMDTGLLIPAIGSRAGSMEGLPFDERRGVLPNDGGRVLDAPDGTPVPGLYCAGWSKRGSNGGIGANRTCAAETVARVIEDFRAGRLTAPCRSPAEFETMMERLCPERIDFSGWRRIDMAERKRGKAQGRHRCKITDTDTMIAEARHACAAGPEKRGRN